MVHGVAVDIDAGVDAADLDQRALDGIDLVDVDVVGIALAHRNQVHALSAEHEAVADIDVVMSAATDELELGTVQRVDMQTAARALVGADDQAERWVGRVDPDRRVVGGAAVGRLHAGEDLEQAGLGKGAALVLLRGAHPHDVHPERVSRRGSEARCGGRQRVARAGLVD